MCLGHPLVGVKLVYEKSVGICICYRPTVRGFSHCPIKVGRQLQKPTPVYAISTSGTVSLECAGSKIITYPRASTVAKSLTSIRNFARISRCQESARINAFLLCLLHPASHAPCPDLALTNHSPLAWPAMQSATTKLAIIFLSTKQFSRQFRKMNLSTTLTVSIAVLAVQRLHGSQRS